MPITLIEQFKDKKEAQVRTTYEMISSESVLSLSKYPLNISEMFGNTIQGEGIWAGHPATFMRMQGCTLDCVWCDTAEVWRQGNAFSAMEVLHLLNSSGLVDKLRQGQHLVLTGGSPLKQQTSLVYFLKEFKSAFGFKPYIEVENECVLLPNPDFAKLVDCWNNSPKLQNSGMKTRARWKPEVIQATSQLPNSWFKFVISNYSDWQEVLKDFIEPGYISKDQVILMPEGQNQQQLAKTRDMVASIAVDVNVLFSDRLHITIWDKKTGV